MQKDSRNAVIDDYIRKDMPFGPIKTDNINSPVVIDVLFDKENKINQKLERSPAFIVGRKGSGKTAFLKEKLTDNKNIIIEIKTFDAFSEVIDCINKISKERKIFVDHVANIWEYTVWSTIFLGIIDRHKDDNLCSLNLSKINRYVNGIGDVKTLTPETILGCFIQKVSENSSGWVGAISSTVNDLKFLDVSFSDARMEAEEYLQRQSIKVFILMDSMEDFHREIETVNRPLAGLFRFIGRIEPMFSYYEVRFCFPAELWHVLPGMSTNPMKDFQNHITLHWHSKELVRIAAYRFSIFLKLHEPDFYEKNNIKNLNMDKTSDAISLFELIFPKTISNGISTEEDTIGYILRHTQLLPRQFIRILNRICEKNRRYNNSPTLISAEAIKGGIRRSEEIITNEIFDAYQYVHPNARLSCQKCIPELPLKFSSNELHHIFNQHGKRGVWFDDFDNFKDMLIEIGAIGRVIDETDKYIIGEFEYTVPHKLFTAHDDDLCLHPLFTEVFSSKDLRNGKVNLKPVYPYGTDISGEEYRDL